MRTVQLSAAGRSRVAPARLLALIAMVAASLAPAAQSARQVEAAAYYTLIKDYRQGRVEAAIDALVAMPAGATKSVVNASDLHWSADEMNAAALLETEAAFRSGLWFVLSARLSNADLWLVKARKYFDAPGLNTKVNTNRQDDFSRRWSLTVGRRALWLMMAGLAEQILKEACEKFPKDAELHLAYGLAWETVAFAVNHVYVASIAAYRSGLESALLSPTSTRTDALSQAREAFERAINLKPSSAEARLRLAHVYIRLKDDRRAAPHLEHARTLESLPEYRFLASILLGDLRRRAGDTEAAIELYLSARRLLPNAQSAYIAHAHALRAAGRSEEATAVVAEMLGRETHQDDPWVNYPRGLEPTLAEFGPLRALVQEK